MEGDARSGLARTTIAGSAFGDETPKNAETRSIFVLGTLAGLALGMPAVFLLVVATPKIVVASVGAFVVTVYVVFRLRRRHALVAAPQPKWTIFFGAAASAVFPVLLALCASSLLDIFWPDLLRFPPR